MIRLPAVRLWATALLSASLTLASPSALAQAAQPADYRLAYGDALTVTIVGQPTLSVVDEPIRPDGQIAVPLMRQVVVKGKTVEEVRAALTQGLKPYLAQPQVVVTVSRFRPLRITLLGQVRSPGTFNFTEPPSLLDALAVAGGMTERGDRTMIKLVAPGGATQRLDLDALLAGRTPVPRVEEGSVIEVAEVGGPDWYRTLPIFAGLLTAVAVMIRR